MKQRHPWTDEDDAIIVEMEGHPIREIAIRLHRNPAAIDRRRQFLRKEGHIPPFIRATRSPQVVALYQRDLTVSEIAARCGITYNRVREILISNNVLRPRTSL